MASIVDGATSFGDLPLAPESRAWDKSAARKSIARWASSDGSGDKDKVNWSKFRKGFMWYDAASPEDFGSYKFPFADVTDGTLKAVWNGIRAVMSRVGGASVPDADKGQIRSHCKQYYGKFGKPFPKDEAEFLLRELEAIVGLEECLSFRDGVVALCDGNESGQRVPWVDPDAEDEADTAPDLDTVLQQTDDKINALTREGKEEFVESFTSPVKVVDRLHDGRLRVTAVVGQVDVVNKNKRLYPKDEAAKWIQLANRLANRGGMVGYDGHPSLFGGGGRYRDVALKWERFMLQGNDIHAQAITVPGTEAHDEGLGPCFEAGIAVEWSKRGWGNREEVHNKKDEWTHDIIHEYVLDGVDAVGRGADKTRTVELTVESTDEPPIQDGAQESAVQMGDEPKTPEDEKKPEDEKIDEKPAETKDEEKPETPPSPAVDIDELVKRVLTQVEADRDANREADAVNMVEVARKTTEAMMATQALTAHKTQLLATIEDETVRKPIERALLSVGSIEDADTIFGEFAPMVEATLRPEPRPAGVGVISKASAEKDRRENWFLADSTMARPTTAGDAYRMLLESVPSNGKPEWDDPRNIWKFVLDQYEDIHPEYFHYCTPRGYQDATTTTSILGTILPNVLPLLRQLWERLIMFEITSVQPMAGPESRVYFLNFDTSAGVDLSDSSTFDSTWADQTEASTKSQMVPSMEYQNISAADKAIYYSVSAQLIQDARATHGVDLEAELLRAAADEIARELNYGFLDLLRGQASAGSQTYYTSIPTSSNYTGQEWRNVFGTFLEKARSYVFQKVFQTPDWIVADPTAAGIIKSMNVGGLLRGDSTVTYGTGLQYLGVVGQTMRLYEAAWFTANTAMCGYKPPTWATTAHVYAPYIPLYISPRDYTASTNVAERSVSSRQGQKVLRPNGLSLITTASGAGVEPY